MPGAGGGVFNLRQILVLLLVVALTVFLVRQVAWHALLAATGGILFVTAVWGFGFFSSPEGHRRAPRGFRPRGGTGILGGLLGGWARGFFGFWVWVCLFWARPG